MTLARKIYLGKLLGISSQNETCFGMESGIFVVHSDYTVAFCSLAKFQQNRKESKNPFTTRNCKCITLSEARR